MKKQLLPTLGILSAIGVLGLTNVPVSAVPAQCGSAFAFQSNDFGDCSPRLSVSTTPSVPSATFARRADIQVTQVVAKYNSNFAANYAQRVARNDSHTRVANSPIQCQTNGVAQSLCRPGQTQAALSANQRHIAALHKR